MRDRRRIAAVAGAVALAALVIAFALYNRGNPITLRFGLAEWRGEAVYALYAATFLGLLLMFLTGLPADLAARRERRRLEARVDAEGSSSGRASAAEDAPEESSRGEATASRAS